MRKMNKDQRINFSRQKDEGTWGQMTWAYCHLMSRGAKDLLVLLENWCARHKAESKTNGWFFISVRDTIKYINMNKDAQAKCLNELIELGFIKRKLKGIPRMRYIKIDYDAIGNSVILADISNDLK